MPIRFYCPFCDQLLGISSRRAGSAIECPRCHGEVGVPREDASASSFALPDPDPTSGPLTVDVELIPPSPDILLTSNQVALLFLCVFVLLGLAFLAGLIVGAVG